MLFPVVFVLSRVVSYCLMLCRVVLVLSLVLSCFTRIVSFCLVLCRVVTPVAFLARSIFAYAAVKGFHVESSV